MTSQTFEERNSDELQEGGQIPDKENWTSLCLKMSAQGAYRVYDEFDEKDIMRNEDCSFTITTSLPDSKWLIRYLLSFGADVEVLEPPKIRDALRDELNAMMGKYN